MPRCGCQREGALAQVVAHVHQCRITQVGACVRRLQLAHTAGAANAWPLTQVQARVRIRTLHGTARRTRLRYMSVQAQAEQIIAAQKASASHVAACFELVASSQHTEVQFWAITCLLEVRLASALDAGCCLPAKRLLVKSKG